MPGNYNLSIARLKSLLKRFKKDENIAKHYGEVLKEQSSDGILEKADGQNKCIDVTQYLPHHPVFRENVERNEIRVVFAASAKNNKNSLSLNECLHKGPALTPILYDALVRMREYRVVLV